MKGLTHFISGVAAATCFPEAVRLAYDEKALIIALGGIFGILPDTLDFKFGQFFEKYDIIVDPDPDNPDPQKIADLLAKAINDTHSTQQPKSILFLTIKKGADLWRQYRIFFDLDNDKVKVTMGPLVNTSKKPFPNSELPGLKVAEAKLNCKLCRQVYDQETFVDIMTGPSFQFVPKPDGMVKMDFLAWHRRWSHSLTMGVFLGIAVWLLMSIWLGFERALVYGLVSTAGFWIHILEDQLGFMGSNLFWPITKEKSIGTKSMHSGDAMPNFTTVWLALAIIFFNLNQYRSDPFFSESFLVYFAYVFIVPFFCINIIDRILLPFDPPEPQIMSAEVAAAIARGEERTYQSEVIKEREEGFEG